VETRLLIPTRLDSQQIKEPTLNMADAQRDERAKRLAAQALEFVSAGRDEVRSVSTLQRPRPLTDSTHRRKALVPYERLSPSPPTILRSKQPLKRSKRMTCSIT